MKTGNTVKRILCLLLALCLTLSLCGCGKSRFRYGVNTIEVLIEQDYSLAFRNNDPAEPSETGYRIRLLPR